MKTKFLTVLCGCLFTLASINTCPADDIPMAASIADVAVVRPCSFVATIIGSTFFVLALPFAAASHSVKKTAHTLVVQPAQVTFTRPVGDFDALNHS